MIVTSTIKSAHFNHLWRPATGWLYSWETYYVAYLPPLGCPNLSVSLMLVPAYNCWEIPADEGSL